ncbi:MAG: hypothetical protein ACKVZ0_09270 [Gemmatimonadales bacterium]
MLQIPVQDLRRVAATLASIRGESVVDLVMRADLRQLKIELGDGRLLVVGCELDDVGRQYRLTVDVVAPLDDLSRQLDVGLDRTS